jgi:hypothetical protein
MAQTTGAVTGAATAVNIKIAAGSYTDYSGQAQSVDAVTATRANSTAYTFDGDNAIILLGKEEPVKWEPKGTAGGQIETTAGGYITSIIYPAVSAEGAGPVVASITVMAPGIAYTA